MTASGYSKAYIAKAFTVMKAMFRTAAREKLVDRNPFEYLMAGSQVNNARKQFIESDTVFKLIGTLHRFGMAAIGCPGPLGWTANAKRTVRDDVEPCTLGSRPADRSLPEAGTPAGPRDASYSDLGSKGVPR